MTNYIPPSLAFLYYNFLLLIGQHIHQHGYICNKLISPDLSAWLIYRSSTGVDQIIVMTQPKTRNICLFVCFSVGVLLSSTVGLFSPLLELHPSARTNTVNLTLLREGPPPVGTKAGQNPPRGNHTHSIAYTTHSKTGSQVCIHTKVEKINSHMHTLQATWKSYKIGSNCLHLFISAVLHQSYMTDLPFSLSLSLFCCSYLSGNRVCRQLSWV